MQGATREKSGGVCGRTAGSADLAGSTGFTVPADSVGFAGSAG